MLWSAKQEAIFDWFSNIEHGKRQALTVLARAGSGKTVTSTNAVTHVRDPRVDFLFAAFGKDNQKDMEVKFRKIAREERVRNKSSFYVNSNGIKVEARTFHSLGMQEVFANWGAWGNGNGTLRKRNAISDWRAWNLAIEVLPDDASKSVKGLVCRLNKKGRELNAFANIVDLEEMALRFDIIPGLRDEQDGYDLSNIAKYALKAMVVAANGPSRGQIDFADMIYLPIVNGWVRPKYRAVVVDEFQDMSPMQLLMARQICHDTLVIVGDDRQGIYGFRGADTKEARRIREEQNADELGLNVSFRCPKSVVRLARGIVEDFEADDGNVEGAVEESVDIDYSKLIESATAGDVILSRYNAPMVGIVLRLLRAGKAACIKGRRDEVDGFKKTVNLLVEGFGKIPKIDLSKTAQIAGRDEVSCLLSNLSTWHNIEQDRIYTSNTRNVEPLIDALDDRVATLRALCDGATRIQQVLNRLDKIFVKIGEHNCVTLSSVHRFKGQEATHVYVLCDTLRTGGGIEEENIAYVGFTRAMETLTLVNGRVEDFTELEKAA